MAAPRPIVLVHGAWHGAWCWATLQAELDRRGLPSYAVDLPGHGVDDEPLGDLHADVARVERMLATLATDVVLVGHSYGGAVVSGAAHGAAISSLVYLTAFALQPGESVMDVVQTPAPEPKLATAMIVGEDGIAVIDPAGAAEAFYGSCPPAAVEAAIARLSPQPLVTFTQANSTSPLGAVPTTYVCCTLDEAIPLAQQQLMAARCDDVVTLETDHSPFISAVDEVATLLERLARSDRS